METISTDLRIHIEQTRSQASHAYQPVFDDTMADALELCQFLTGTFGRGMVGTAASIGEAQPQDLKPIPMLSSEYTIVKRRPGRPRKYPV